MIGEHIRDKFATSPDRRPWMGAGAVAGDEQQQENRAFHDAIEAWHQPLVAGALRPVSAVRRE